MDKEDYNETLPEELDEWQQISSPFSMDDDSKAQWMNRTAAAAATAATLEIKEDFFNGSSSSSSSPSTLTNHYYQTPPIVHGSSPLSVGDASEPEAAAEEKEEESESEVAAGGVVKSGEVPKWRMIFVEVARETKKYFCGRVRLWSSVLAATAAAGAMSMVVVSWWCVRVRRWRKKTQVEKIEHLMILLRDREQRISQLLLQISHMNEMLSARQKVPVLRIA